MFDEKVFMHIVQQSNLYASRDKNDVDFEVTGNEMYRFLGILLLSRYHCLPHQMDYWSSQQDLGVPIVRDAMSSRRYQTIKRYLHLADNAQLPAGIKTAKVDLLESKNKNLIQFGMFHHDLTINDSMTPHTMDGTV